MGARKERGGGGESRPGGAGRGGAPVRKLVAIPLRQRLDMVAGYAGRRLLAQAKALAFIVVYLLAVQLLVLRVPVEGAVGAALGVVAIAAGLAFFLEGLFLGVMPLGERCGLRLPSRAGPLGVALFALVLGVAATLAEPAIGFLKALGGSVEPWRAPLLFLLLNRGTPWLVAAIAAGVGVAVVIGVFRFIRGWRLKPFILVLLPLLLALSAAAASDPRVACIAGLAWDTGGITTGPVTVPLVIALGIGLSRIAGGDDEAGGGLGVVTLASALPVLAVFALGFALAGRVPAPSLPAEFFSPAARPAASFVAGGEEELRILALSALDSGALSAADLATAFPPEPPAPALAPGGGPAAPESLPAASAASAPAATAAGARAPAPRAATPSFLKPLLDAVKAIVPLVLVLGATLLLVLRERIESADEILLGLAFAVIGMFLFGLGMERGLGALGSQTGRAVPALYAETAHPEKAVPLRGVEPSMILRAAGAEGTAEFLLVEEGRGPGLVRFERRRWDARTGDYLHVPVTGALIGAGPAWAGYLAVLLFALVLGFGATLAEPSLAALGATLEEVTTGTYRSAVLVRTVAAGVGAGMAVGFARILFDLPLAWVLAPPYLVALVLTAFTPDEFAAIAWDSAGVTTGPVTVPLVIAAGLGVGARSGAAESFGVIAAASAFPVLAVLVSGIVLQARSRDELAPGGVGGSA